MYRASKYAVIALVLVSSLIGCRSENALTAPPLAGRTLAGQIRPVGDLAGTSPAGINVTSSGQVATTDGSGNFVFLGLPSTNVQLTFTRGDGVNAKASVDGSASSVVVELQKSQAAVQVTGSNGRGQIRELQGLILAISAEEITVDNASTHKAEKAKITPDTVIRHGMTRLQWSDLEVGDKVHVRTNNDASDLKALEIILQEKDEDEGDNGDDGEQGQIRELEGLIVAVSATEITVDNASTHKHETAKITSETVIRRGNTRLTWSDLKPGDRVHVRTNNVKADLKALEIILQNPGS